MADGNARRLVATLPTSTYETLDALAQSPRFAGNRSAALAWVVEIGAAVLADPAVKATLFPGPSDALAEFVGTRKK